MSVVKRRLIEMFISAAVLSVCIVTVFEVFNLLASTQYNIAIICIFATAVFIAVNMRQMHRCMVDLVRLKLFYKYNFIAYAIFAAINLIFAVFTPVSIFSLLFSFTKVFRYIYEPVTYRQSAVIFHIMMLFVIGIAPFTMPIRYRYRLQHIIRSREEHREKQNSQENKDADVPS